MTVERENLLIVDAVKGMKINWINEGPIEEMMVAGNVSFGSQAKFECDVARYMVM